MFIKIWNYLNLYRSPVINLQNFRNFITIWIISRKIYTYVFIFFHCTWNSYIFHFSFFHTDSTLRSLIFLVVNEEKIFRESLKETIFKPMSDIRANNLEFRQLPSIGGRRTTSDNLEIRKGHVLMSNGYVALTPIPRDTSHKAGWLMHTYCTYN